MRAHPIVACVLLAATLAVPRRAPAAAGTALGETSRAAALANAVSARPGDAGTMLLNPAGLADVRGPVFVVLGGLGRFEQWFARTGEAAEDRSRAFGSFGLALATPLPGPAWLRRVRIGVALDLPFEHALRVSVPVRLDQPSSPLYDGRPERMSAIGAFAVELAEHFRVGMGVQLTPSLDTPTEVTYVAGRDKSVDKSVEVRLDRDLALEVSPFFGVRVQPTEATAIAVVYRDASVSRARGTQRTVAGGIVADDPIDFFQLWDPPELVLGGAWQFAQKWSVSADFTLHEWSQNRSGFDRPLDPPYRDTASLRAGLEWKARPWLLARAGWAVEPAPVREQVGATNHLAPSTTTLAAGAGVDLRPLVRVPVLVDLHVRARVGAQQSAHKDPAALPDSNADLPGQQIDNLGFPGFRAGSSAVQLGVTLTVFLAGEAGPAPHGPHAAYFRQAASPSSLPDGRRAPAAPDGPLGPLQGAP